MPRIDPLKKYSYLIGQKINKWTVLELKHDRRNADALCRCECGSVKLVKIGNLINNLSKDCGCGRKKTLSEISTKNIVGQKFGRLTAIELLPESNKFKRRLYRCICDCGNDGIILPSGSLISHHTSSCGCLLSYYNMYIKQFLDSNNIINEPEYRVYIDNVLYRFDFYLPEYNLFIEYDGEQHFAPAHFSQDDEVNQQNFIKVQERDKIKNEYCKNNGYNLLRIPYWESKNIETIISNHLQRLSDKDAEQRMQQSELTQ